MDLSGDGNKLEMNNKIDVIDVTAFGSAGKGKLEGLYEVVFTYTAFWNGAAAKNDVTFYNAWGVQTTGLPLKYDVDKGGVASGGIEYSCNAIMSNHKDTSPVDKVIAIDATFESSGAVTRAAL